MLSPVNPAAREAVSAIDGRCVVKITKANRNQRRRALYWIVTGIVADILNDLHGMSLTDNDLHDIIRRKLGYFTEHTLPSGEVFVKLRSTSDKAMSEPERAEFMQKAFRIFSLWTGVEVEALTQEASAA
jgi:hypothetical protein